MDGFVKILLDVEDSYASLGAESGEGKVHQGETQQEIDHLVATHVAPIEAAARKLELHAKKSTEALRKLEPQLSQKLNRTLTDVQKADWMDKMSRRLRSQARTIAQAELKSGGGAHCFVQLWRDDGSPAIDDTLIDTDSSSNNDSSENHLL